MYDFLKYRKEIPYEGRIYYFQNPQTKEEITDLIKEFCQKHDLKYWGTILTETMTVNIEGESYTVDVREEKEDSGDVYWIIYCLRKKHLYLFRNILESNQTVV